MAWFIWLALYLASFLIQRALAPKPETPQPKGLSDFNLPTADASRPIPVIFGTVKLGGPNVIWYGNLSNTSIEASGQVVGYKYYLTMDLGLCHGPIDELRTLSFGEKEVALELEASGADWERYRIAEPELFGGDSGSGGIEGDVVVYFGAANPTRDLILLGLCSAQYPGLPHLAHLVLEGWDGGGMYLGNSEYIQPVAATATRCPNTLGLTGGKHRIVPPGGGGYDANPACMLYELYTDPIYGLGRSSSEVDLESFREVGETLYAEGFGLAMVWDQQMAAKDFAAEILRHIDGDLFGDPLTGLLTLALTRADYDPDELLVLDQSSISELEFTRGSWSETSNAAKVTYTSRLENYTSRVAQWQNQANYQIRGQLTVVELEFRGLSNAWAANLVAARLLKTVSYPLGRFGKVKVNRTAWALRPGSVFKLNWPPLEIAGMLCRVTRPASGELTDGRLSLAAIEDAFSVTGDPYGPPPETEWVDPLGPAAPAAAQVLFEAPHQFAGFSDRFALALAARADGTLLGYQIWSDPAGGTAFTQTNSVGHFNPTGLLSDPYPAETDAIDETGFEIESGLDLALLASVSSDEFTHGVNLALIDQELIAYRTVTDLGSGHYQLSHVMRGVLDTVAGSHSASARVWLLSATWGGDGGSWFDSQGRPSFAPGFVNPRGPYQSDLTVAVKLLPRNARQVLALSLATAMSLTTASRALKPLPPGKVRLNGEPWPETVTGDAVVTWRYRHRLEQTEAGIVVSQDADDFAAAPEGDYTIEVRVNGVLKRTVTGITAKTWTYTEAMKTADDPDPDHPVAIRIMPVNGSLSGTYQEREFLMP